MSSAKSEVREKAQEKSSSTSRRKRGAPAEATALPEDKEEEEQGEGTTGRRKTRSAANKASPKKAASKVSSPKADKTGAAKRGKRSETRTASAADDTAEAPPVKPSTRKRQRADAVTEEAEAGAGPSTDAGKADRRLCPR